MADLARDRRIANGLLAAFGTTAILCLSLPLAGPVRAFKACVSYLVNPAPFLGARAVDRFEGLPAGIVDLLRADVENRRLRQEIARLTVVEAESRSLRIENERLRHALGMRPASGVALRWARIIERDAEHWHRVVGVAAGREDGVEIGAPVVGMERGRLGAVGRVIEVWPRTSKVLLLTDGQSSLAGYSPVKHWEGLVEGQDGPRLKMNYLPLDAQLAVGEQVYTSVTSATFPPDILVGSITRVFARDPFLTFQSAEVTPAVRGASLKEVLILMPQKPEPVPLRRGEGSAPAMVGAARRAGGPAPAAAGGSP